MLYARVPGSPHHINIVSYVVHATRRKWKVCIQFYFHYFLAGTDWRWNPVVLICWGNQWPELSVPGHSANVAAAATRRPIRPRSSNKKNSSVVSNHLDIQASTHAMLSVSTRFRIDRRRLLLPEAGPVVTSSSCGKTTGEKSIWEIGTSRPEMPVDNSNGPAGPWPNVRPAEITLPFTTGRTLRRPFWLVFVTALCPRSCPVRPTSQSSFAARRWTRFTPLRRPSKVSNSKCGLCRLNRFHFNCLRRRRRRPAVPLIVRLSVRVVAAAAAAQSSRERVTTSASGTWRVADYPGGNSVRPSRRGPYGPPVISGLWGDRTSEFGSISPNIILKRRRNVSSSSNNNSSAAMPWG